jgi:hypothetical protein
MLRWVLASTGYEAIVFCDYGESEDANLRGLERHELSPGMPGYPSLWIVEAKKSPGNPISFAQNVYQELSESFIPMVASGH